MRAWLIALLREPLIHFCVLGAGLFAVYGALGRESERGPANIVVSSGRIEHLALGFARTWQRPPSADELQTLIREYVREEVYYREALAMRLDQDDTVIRRRLRQKLEFVSEDVSALAEPLQRDLEVMLESQPERFRTEPRFTFRHVYLNPQQRGERLARDTTALLKALHSAGARADISALGDRFLLETEFVSVTTSEIAAQFGATFAKALGDAPLETWSGPLASGYGMHLVYVSERAPGRVPPLEEIREIVRREWANGEREKASEAFYRKLLARYTVTVERSNGGSAVELVQR